MHKLKVLTNGYFFLALALMQLGACAPSDGSISSRESVTVALAGQSTKAGRSSVRHEGPVDRADRNAPMAIELIKIEEFAGAPLELDRPAPPLPSDGDPRPEFKRPEHIRGLYVNKAVAGSTRRMDSLIALANRTEVNSLVIDIRDVTGILSYRSEVPLAKEIGAARAPSVSNMLGLLRKLELYEIYPIARIVVVKDALLAEARPDLAIQDIDGGTWKDANGVSWMDPWNPEMWEYPIALAREVVGMGFPEVQWDYIRFPDAPASAKKRAVFAGRDDRSDPEIIRAFLEYSRKAMAELDPVITADLFGVTTTARRDVGIGQVWESFIDKIDVALPMVYPSHYWKGSYGFEKPNFHPYEIVNRALEDAVARSSVVEGAGTTMPWLQDFDYTPPVYNAPEVRAQIQATYDAGIQEWVLWNPGSRYTEEALEPVGGFWQEPLIRVGGQIVPVSQRFEALRAYTDAEKNPGGDGSNSGSD